MSLEPLGEKLSNQPKVEIILSPEERAEARTAVLTGGVFKLKNVRFAGRQSSNNKLDMEELQTQPEKRAKIIAPLRKIVRVFAPDLLVGIPREGQNWALEIGELEGIDVAELAKEDEELKTFRYANKASRLLVARSSRIGVIEDTTTRRTNENGVYTCCPEIAQKAFFCATGWARALPEERIHTPGIPLIAVVEEHIPYDLTAKHPLFIYATAAEAEVS